MINGEELKRYSRQIILPEIGLKGQESLNSAKVLVIGAGGLGCPVLQYLTAAGIGEIGIADDDVVDITNLHRQLLYSTADIGKPKVTIAKEKLNLLNPYVRILEFNLRITLDNAASLCSKYDLVIDGSDNFETRYLINDTCASLGKVLVFGSIYKFEGHISVFNYKNGPNYRDIFPVAPESDEVPNCAEIGVIGVIPGIIGGLMANEAIKIICNIGEPLSGKLMTYNALDNSVSIFNCGKDPKGVQSSPEQLQAPANISEITIDQLNRWLIESSDDICLIDVREPYEFEGYNIGGINIPLHELAEHIDSFSMYKKLVFYCQSGQRSKMAIQLLRSLVTGEMYSVKNALS